MTNIYAHISNGDAPKSQHVTEVSFVDENGKHIDIGGGGTTEIHTDATLAGTGTTDNPLKLSDTTNQKIEKAGTITDDNLKTASPINETDVVCVAKTTNGRLCLKFTPTSGISVYTDPNTKIDFLNMKPATASQRGTVSIGDNMSVDGNGRISVPAITSIKNIDLLSSSATLADVINKVNEILNAAKNAQALNNTAQALNNTALG